MQGVSQNDYRNPHRTTTVILIWFNFFYDGDFEQCVNVLGNGLIHLVIMFTGNQLLIQLSLV